MKWGIGWGLAMAAAFSFHATLVLIVNGNSVFREIGTTYPASIASYAAAGVLAGAIIGTMRPLGTSLLGVLLLSVAASVPAYLSFRTALKGFAPWAAQDTAGLIVMPLIWGVPIGVVIWFQNVRGGRSL